jgi:hypothetical protein
VYAGPNSPERQGTTSQLAEKLFADGFVSGHDFSRAEKSLFLSSRGDFSRRGICFPDFFGSL